MNTRLKVHTYSSSALQSFSVHQNIAESLFIEWDWILLQYDEDALHNVVAGTGF